MRFRALAGLQRPFRSTLDGVGGDKMVACPRGNLKRQTIGPAARCVECRVYTGRTSGTGTPPARPGLAGPGAQNRELDGHTFRHRPQFHYQRKRQTVDTETAITTEEGLQKDVPRRQTGLSRSAFKNASL